MTAPAAPTGLVLDCFDDAGPPQSVVLNSTYATPTVCFVMSLFIVDRCCRDSRRLVSPAHLASAWPYYRSSPSSLLTHPGYSVVYNAEPSQFADSTVITPNSTQLSFNVSLSLLSGPVYSVTIPPSGLSSLVPFANYSVKIAPINVISTGPFSSSVVVQVLPTGISFDSFDSWTSPNSPTNHVDFDSFYFNFGFCYMVLTTKFRSQWYYYWLSFEHNSPPESSVPARLLQLYWNRF